MSLRLSKANVKVVLLDHGPFGGQRHQERDFYMTKAMYEGFQNKSNVYALPAPVNGIRCSETYKIYDNYLEDPNGTRLEEAIYEQEITIRSSESDEVITTSDALDSLAVARFSEIQKTKEESAAASGQEIDEDAAELEREYFTWVTDISLFDDSLVPMSSPFNEPPSVDNAPRWTYQAIARPGNTAGTEVYFLAPFQRNSPPSRLSPLHWGVKKKTGIAQNQGFELTYTFCQRDPSLSEINQRITSRYDFVDANDNPINFSVATSLYFAFEFGIDSDRNHLLFIFRNEDTPKCFRIDRATGKAVLVASFDSANGKQIFDPNNKFFTVSVEPVLGALILRSNIFFETPWIIFSEKGRNDPLFIDRGPLMIYGGNLQSGFLFRPLTYEHTGKFEIPNVSFEFMTRSSGGDPIVSLGLKGAGDVEQDRTYILSDKTLKTIKDGELSQADAEKAILNGVTSKIKTILDYEFEGKVNDAGLDRKIKVGLKLQPIVEGAETAEVGGLTIFRIRTGTLETKNWTATVELESSDYEQPNGYVVEDGRSPYIWFLSIIMPPIEMDEPNEEKDISCDVLGMDLNWNATSFNEASQSGTIKILNNRRTSPIGDYRALSDRTTYLRIYAGFDGCVPAARQGLLFEGLTTGLTIDKVAGKETVSLRIEDYMNVLQSSKIYLSPVYDGMKATLAVRDIIKVSGINDSRIVANDKPVKEANLSDDYGLPFVQPFDQPQFRYSDGQSLKDCILKISKIDFRTIYFDQAGRFHLDDIPGGEFGDAKINPVAKFFTSPRKPGYTNVYDLVWNNVSYSTAIKDVYNGLQIVTVDRRIPSITYIVQDSYAAGVNDPSAKGYLGYFKPMIIREAAFGSQESIARYAAKLRKTIFQPPLTVKFEAFGHAALRTIRSDGGSFLVGAKPLDIIELDGQPLRILNISTRIDAKDGSFFQSYEGEWFYSVGKGQDKALARQVESTTISDGGAGRASAS